MNLEKKDHRNESDFNQAIGALAIAVKNKTDRISKKHIWLKTWEYELKYLCKNKTICEVNELFLTVAWGMNNKFFKDKISNPIGLGMFYNNLRTKFVAWQIENPEKYRKSKLRLNGFKSQSNLSHRGLNLKANSFLPDTLRHAQDNYL